MSTYYDEQGNEVEAFSKEELEAQLAEKLKAVVPPVVEKKPEQDLNPVLQRLETTEKALYEMRVDKLADSFAGTDAEKRTVFTQKFNRLTGYDDTNEGLLEKAKDAAKLAFGDVGSIATGALGDTGGRNIDGKSDSVAMSEADKVVQAALGITQADVDKFGKK